MGALAGGTISGIIGFLTTRYDRKLVRKEFHLREHRDNLKQIELALISLKEQIWPLTAKGSDDLLLPRWEKPPLGEWLKKYTITDFVSVRTVSNDNYRVVAIDPTLYSDVKNHFPELYSKLTEVEQKTRTDGFKLGELVFEVSKAIYETLASSELSVLKWTLEKGVRATLREIMKEGGNESQWYAGAVFLMLLREDTGNWPNEYKQLEHYGLLTGLERLAGEIKKAKGPRAIEMVKLREGMFQAINDCAGMLEVTAHKTSLKGGCEYL